MKFIKNILLAAFIPVMMFSCNPLEDVYNELDVLEEEAGADAGLSINYTLTSDDYSTLQSTFNAKKTVEDSAKANFIDQYSALNSSFDISEALGDFVNNKYPQLKKGAAVKVTYNILDAEDFFDGSAEYVNATSYSLSDDDYASVSAEAGTFSFFDRNVNVEEEISTILQTSIQDPGSGDIVVANYLSIEEAYADLTGEVALDEPFETDLNGFESVSITGPDQVWAWGTFGGDTYARMSGFASGAQVNEDWLVSPAIDLTSESSDITLFITQILNFQGASEWGSELDVLFTTNYTGDVSTTTWTSLGADLSAYPDGDNYDLYDAEVSLPNAEGNTIHVAFSYKSTTDFAALWEIVDVRVEAGAAPETTFTNVFFEYDGSSWDVSEDAYFLTSADYDAMGEGSGQPGRFDNFSDDVPPANYLPTLLSNRFPFAQEGDEFVVAYRYFNGSTSTRGDVYTFTAGAWAPAVNDDQIISKTDQFVNTGSEFIFDPSVVVFMTSSDYQIIVDEVSKSKPELVNSFGTGEDLYGSDAFFNNFDLRLSSRLETDDADNPLQPEYVGLSTEDGEALIQERLLEGLDVFLEAKYSDAQTIDGIDIFYTVNFATFDGGNSNGTEVFILTDVGTFELFAE